MKTHLNNNLYPINYRSSNIGSYHHFDANYPAIFQKVSLLNANNREGVTSLRDPRDVSLKSKNMVNELRSQIQRFLENPINHPKASSLNRRDISPMTSGRQVEPIKNNNQQNDIQVLGIQQSLQRINGAGLQGAQISLNNLNKKTLKKEQPKKPKKDKLLPSKKALEKVKNDILMQNNFEDIIGESSSSSSFLPIIKTQKISGSKQVNSVSKYGIYNECNFLREEQKRSANDQLFSQKNLIKCMDEQKRGYNYPALSSELEPRKKFSYLNEYKPGNFFQSSSAHQQSQINPISLPDLASSSSNNQSLLQLTSNKKQKQSPQKMTKKASTEAKLKNLSITQAQGSMYQTIDHEGKVIGDPKALQDRFIKHLDYTMSPKQLELIGGDEIFFCQTQEVDEEQYLTTHSQKDDEECVEYYGTSETQILGPALNTPDQANAAPSNDVAAPSRISIEDMSASVPNRTPNDTKQIQKRNSQSKLISPQELQVARVRSSALFKQGAIRKGKTLLDTILVSPAGFNKGDTLNIPLPQSMTIQTPMSQIKEDSSRFPKAGNSSNFTQQRKTHAPVFSHSQTPSIQGQSAMFKRNSEDHSGYSVRNRLLQQYSNRSIYQIKQQLKADKDFIQLVYQKGKKLPTMTPKKYKGLIRLTFNRRESMQGQPLIILFFNEVVGLFECERDPFVRKQLNQKAYLKKGLVAFLRNNVEHAQLVLFVDVKGKENVQWIRETITEKEGIIFDAIYSWNYDEIESEKYFDLSQMYLDFGLNSQKKSVLNFVESLKFEHSNSEISENQIREYQNSYDISDKDSGTIILKSYLMGQDHFIFDTLFGIFKEDEQKEKSENLQIKVTQRLDGLQLRDLEEYYRNYILNNEDKQEKLPQEEQFQEITQQQKSQQERMINNQVSILKDRNAMIRNEIQKYREYFNKKYCTSQRSTSTQKLSQYIEERLNNCSNLSRNTSYQSESKRTQEQDNLEENGKVVVVGQRVLGQQAEAMTLVNQREIKQTCHNVLQWLCKR